jgi:hypothetical protein
MAILNLCQVLVLQRCFRKNWSCAGRSTWRVLPWHGNDPEYSEGTAGELDAGHVGLTRVA